MKRLPSFQLWIVKVLVASAWLSGCYRPLVEDCSILCGAHGECPPDMVCSNGSCGRSTSSCAPSEGGGGAGAGGAGGDGQGGAAGNGTGGTATGGSANGGAGAGGAVDAGAGGASDTDGPNSDTAAYDGGDAAAEAATDAHGGLDVDAMTSMDGDLDSSRPDGLAPGSNGGAADGGGDASTPTEPRCPARQYLNVVRQICVPAHDLNADGKVDMLAVSDHWVDALISDGSRFVFVPSWFDGTFRAFGGAYAADVTGEGYADGVAFWETQSYVATTGGPKWGSDPANVSLWSEEPLLLGTRGTFVADVNGDGRWDHVQLNEDGIRVALSTGTHFNPLTDWRTQSFEKFEGGFFADVNGDDRADAILARGQGIDVMLSDGTRFGPAALWYAGAFPNGVGRFFADVNGDGRADGIRVNSIGTYVILSTGGGFGAEQNWYSDRSPGDITNFVADVDGDGRADLVQLDRASVNVALSTGQSFGPMEQWYSGQFFASWDVTVAPEPAGARAYRP